MTKPKEPQRDCYFLVCESCTSNEKLAPNTKPYPVATRHFFHHTLQEYQGDVLFTQTEMYRCIVCENLRSYGSQSCEDTPRLPVKVKQHAPKTRIKIN